jgi:hypothetical protein
VKILYLSCHSILEYDELKLFGELDYDYFSIGAYINPTAPHDPKRPPLPGKFHEHLASVSMVHNQLNLHPEQIEWADVIIVMHVPEWIEANWSKIKHKRVIWRSIGQSVQGVEERLKPYRLEGMEVVRYSPNEANIPGYMGSSGLIRFYKDPDEFGGWNGATNEVVTFAQSMKSRGEFCNFDAFEAETQNLNAHVYGPNNEDAGALNGGMLDYDQLKRKMRDARAYYYTGTHPASYTLNFLEAWMTGVPVVALGPALGNSKIFPGQTYEVAELIRNGETGYVSDDPAQRRRYIEMLLQDKTLAKQIGANARAEAAKIFGKEVIKQQWKKYLEGSL